MKKDEKLGIQIMNYLYSKGVETPRIYNKLDQEQKFDIIKHSFKDIMKTLGLDLYDDSLKNTPDRIAKMYLEQIFSGLDYSNFPKCTTVENKMNYDEMIIVQDINMQSTCEHHFALIDGFAKIAYIPNKKILGLSKFNRIVKFFSQRPQIQERLTEQIYFALSFILGTKDIAVMIKATHYCVKARGVEDQTSYTTTSKLGGVFREKEVRNEFLNL